MLTEQDLTYCPNCGKKFAEKKENLLVCGNCDLHYYINPRPTNAVIFENEKGELLFIKRKWPPYKGYLDLVGGFIDPNETAEESVKREVREETGIELKDFTYFTSVTDRYEFKILNYHTVCVIFTAIIPSSTKIEAGDDAGEVLWINKNELDFEKIAFEGLKKALKKYLSLNKS